MKNNKSSSITKRHFRADKGQNSQLYSINTTWKLLCVSQWPGFLLTSCTLASLWSFLSSLENKTNHSLPIRSRSLAKFPAFLSRSSWSIGITLEEKTAWNISFVAVLLCIFSLSLTQLSSFLLFAVFSWKCASKCFTLAQLNLMELSTELWGSVLIQR